MDLLKLIKFSFPTGSLTLDTDMHWKNKQPPWVSLREFYDTTIYANSAVKSQQFHPQWKAISISFPSPHILLEELGAGQPQSQEFRTNSGTARKSFAMRDKRRIRTSRSQHSTPSNCHRFGTPSEHFNIFQHLSMLGMHFVSIAWQSNMAN